MAEHAPPTDATYATGSLAGYRILLVIAGGIAAYKSLDLIRRLRERGARLRCVLTQGGAQFITPLSVASLSEAPVYTDLWSLKDETEMGHIRLSRESDLIIIAPASANILAQMAQGLATDLATTTLLAADKPILVAPAMNQMMWGHPATQANIETLRERGVFQVGPGAGDMACGETGSGRMAEPLEIVAAATTVLRGHGPLRGKRAIVTTGPTMEPLDPVRFISNRSSGKQGHAIAAALARAGADTIMVSGPTNLAPPPGVQPVFVETAEQMLAASLEALPADIAICAAAVSDWRAAVESDQKLKKDGSGPPSLALTENPDILATLSQRGNDRPTMVVGFAAETHDLLDNARAKLERKGCDWLLANDVSTGTSTFGGDDNSILWLTQSGDHEEWPRMSKQSVAEQLIARLASHFAA